MKDRYFWRQVFILLIYILFDICIGFMIGFPAILNAALLSSNSTDIRTTSNHASWITAINGIGGVIGALTLNSMLNLWGRKSVHITMGILQIIGWLTFVFSNNVTYLYIARFVQGVSVGGIYSNCIIISEYAHPTRRGIFMSLKKISVAVGSLICHSMEPFWTWRQIAMFAAALPTASALLTLLTPETPSYLALKGKYHECQGAFKWLHGTSQDSKDHLKKLLDSQMQRAEINETISNNMVNMMKKCLQKDFWKPILIITILSLCLDLCGRYYFVAYIIEIMTKLLGNKTSALYFTLGSDMLTVAALCSSSVVIRCFNRRTILFWLGGLSVLLMLVVSLIIFLDTVLQLSPSFLLLTAVLLILQSFIANLSVIPVSFTIIGEIMPLEHKSGGMAASGMIFTLLYALVLKLTPVLMEYTELYGTYAIYGVALGLCLLSLYKILPETKDKSLEVIEDEIRNRESNFAEGHNLIKRMSNAT